MSVASCLQIYVTHEMGEPVISEALDDVAHFKTRDRALNTMHHLNFHPTHLGETRLAEQQRATNFDPALAYYLGCGTR